MHWQFPLITYQCTAHPMFAMMEQKYLIPLLNLPKLAAFPLAQ
jgi:hypothetical protein